MEPQSTIEKEVELSTTEKNLSQSNMNDIDAVSKAILIDEMTDYDIEVYERIHSDNRKYSGQMDDLEFYTSFNLLFNFESGQESGWTDDQLRHALLHWSKQIITYGSCSDNDEILTLRINIASVLLELLERDKIELVNQIKKTELQNAHFRQKIKIRK